MNRLIYFFACLFGLCSFSTAWAANTLSVRLTGLKNDVEKNVQLVIENETNSIKKEVNAQSVEYLYKNLSKKIKTAMQPYGYFEPNISTRLIRQNNQWVIFVSITPGQAVYLTSVKVTILGQGTQDSTFDKLKNNLPIKTGDILNTEKYNLAKQHLFDLASIRGYFDAKMVENKIYLNLNKHQAEIIIKFQTGIRYRFGETTFSKSPFSIKFLNRFLNYQKGKYYNYKRIENTRKNFIDSDYFAQVSVTPETDKLANQQVPIRIRIAPKKRYAYKIGLGYGTDTGPRATLGYDIRRINNSGHQFKSLIQAAENNSFLTAAYLIPGVNPASDLYEFSTSYADFNQVTGTGKSFNAQGSYTSSLGNWKQTIALAYLREDYNIVNFPATKTTLLYPNINWRYINRQDILYPKSGFSFSGNLAGATSAIVSKTSFFQAKTTVKSLFTLFDSTRFLLHLSLARTDINNLGSLPLSLQLFAGGAQSIRGYRYNSIGPGRNLFVGSIEIQQRIKGNWYLTAFFDAGNVTDGNPFNQSTLFEGVGPGIAWLSPVGIVEVTFANAISLPDKPWLIQFTMGPSI